MPPVPRDTRHAPHQARQGELLGFSFRWLSLSLLRI